MQARAAERARLVRTLRAEGVPSTDRATGALLAGMERAGVFRGRYHVLGGALSPIDGVGPEQLVSLLPRFTACATKPLLMQPNAGLPEYQDGKTVYLVGPDAFSNEMKKLASGGVWGLGGCCGTTPDHTARLAALAHEAN